MADAENSPETQGRALDAVADCASLVGKLALPDLCDQDPRRLVHTRLALLHMLAHVDPSRETDER